MSEELKNCPMCHQPLWESIDDALRREVEELKAEAILSLEREQEMDAQASISDKLLLRQAAEIEELKAELKNVQNNFSQIVKMKPSNRGNK